MPAMARHRLDTLYFGLVGGELKKLAKTYMVSRDDAINRVVDFIAAEFIQYNFSSYADNQPVYDQVILEEVVKQANKFDWPFEAQNLIEM